MVNGVSCTVFVIGVYLMKHCYVNISLLLRCEGVILAGIIIGAAS